MDTSVIIDHLQSRGSGQTILMELAGMVAKENLAVSVITIQELCEGKSAEHSKKEEYLLATISPLRILPYNFEVAKFPGEIARRLKQYIEFADAAIASTAILNRASLLTLDKKHFHGIRELEIYQP